MQLPTYILAISALIPAIVLLVYIYIKDRSEKEPIGLLLLLFFAGAFMTLPAYGLEILFSKGINSFFSLFITEQGGEYYFISRWFYYGYRIADNFIGIALVEEGLKWLALVLITGKNKNFNSLFDGVIYAIFVSLGFAALENVLYVIDGGIMYALRRAFTAIPGHMFNAVFMGCYYSAWHIYGMADQYEKYCYDAKLISYKSNKFDSTPSAVYNFVIPVLVHGFYDLLCTMTPTSKLESIIMTVAFYAFLIFLYFYCFNRIRKMSKSDCQDTTLAVVLLEAQHPGLLVRLKELGEAFANELNKNK